MTNFAELGWLGSAAIALACPVLIVLARKIGLKMHDDSGSLATGAKGSLVSAVGILAGVVVVALITALARMPINLDPSESLSLLVGEEMLAANQPIGVGVTFYGVNRDEERLLHKAISELKSRYLL
jgi:hypothetical protein